jgi:GntR family transcriptional repressor for pyruvate dehydrogenase complex
MFKPVKKTRIHEEIVSKIRDMIDQVREALRALESQGFLTSRQGDGTYVSQQPIEQLIEPFASMITREKFDQLELFEMRRLIEPQLAYLAAERATPAEIAEMEQLVLIQQEELAGRDLGLNPDQTLHNVLTRAAKNKILISIMDSLMDSLAESRDRYLQVEGRQEKSLIRHKMILAAIKAGDSQLASDLMLEHLEETESMLFELLHLNEEESDDEDENNYEE